MLWPGAACLDRAAISALIASHLSNAPLRANAAKGVTGYDQATLLREWALEALMLPSNRDHAHVDPTPSAPPSTSSAPDQVTVALASAAGGLRAHHRCPGRHGGLGHPAAPTVTAKPSPRPRPADRPDRASPEPCADAHHRAAGADHRAHRLDLYPSHRAAGRQRVDHSCWIGQRPRAGHGGHDDQHRGLLDLGRHQHPACGDRPDHHHCAAHDHDRADDHGRTDHDHAGHHDEHRAHHDRADNDDRCRAHHHHRCGGVVALSEATPGPIEPSTPSTEQLGQWRALVDRIRQGDRSEVVAWDEVTAARPVATYQVLVTQRVRQRLRDAPPTLIGSIAGIIAVLRVDPTEASMIFRLRRLGDAGWRVTFGAPRGSLTYWVVQAEQLWCCST